MKDDNSVKWLTDANKFAKYMLIMFRPWNSRASSSVPTAVAGPHSGVLNFSPYESLDYQLFVDWVKQAYEHEDEWLDRVRACAPVNVDGKERVHITFD